MLPTVGILEKHYSDVIMSAMTSQITSVSIVYSTVCSGADQRKLQSSVSLVLWGEFSREPVNSTHKGPVTLKKLYLMTSSYWPWDDRIALTFITPDSSLKCFLLKLTQGGMQWNPMFEDATSNSLQVFIFWGNILWVKLKKKKLMQKNSR